MNNSAEIFEIGLGLVQRCFVENVIFETINDVRELHINFQKGYKFKNENELPIHDTMQRTLQYLNFFQHKCFVHALIPRVKGFEGKVNLVQVALAKKLGSSQFYDNV